MGEGTIRTLVKRIRGVGLVQVTRSGMTLTHKGRELLLEFKERILTTEFPATSITVDSQNYAVLVKGAVKIVRKGIE